MVNPAGGPKMVGRKERSTPAPVLASELPNVSFDVNEIIAYAKKRGVAVWELTEAELAPFMHVSGDWRAFRRKYYSLYGMPSK